MTSTILLIAGLMAIVIILVAIMKKLKNDAEGTDNEIKICKTTGELCCGGGDNCHKHTGKTKTNTIQYFEDEELDRFKGRSASEYSPREVDEWRNIVETLRPHEIRSWVTSIHRRELHIPSEIGPAIKDLMASAPQA